jgi:hypothetical protein
MSIFASLFIITLVVLVTFAVVGYFFLKSHRHLKKYADKN